MVTSVAEQLSRCARSTRCVVETYGSEPDRTIIIKAEDSMPPSAVMLCNNDNVLIDHIELDRRNRIRIQLTT